VDADGEKHEVRGEGVIGHQPDLAPGQAFEYTSYCPLPTPWGTMEGEYTMQDEHGDLFEAAIGGFIWSRPARTGDEPFAAGDTSGTCRSTAVDVGVTRVFGKATSRLLWCDKSAAGGSLLFGHR